MLHRKELPQLLSNHLHIHRLLDHFIIVWIIVSTRQLLEDGRQHPTCLRLARFLDRIVQDSHLLKRGGWDASRAGRGLDTGLGTLLHNDTLLLWIDTWGRLCLYKRLVTNVVLYI